MTDSADELRERLRALPDFPLPETLWQRVEAGRRRKLQRRKLGGGIAAMLLVGLMATPLLAPMLSGTRGPQLEQANAQRPADDAHDVQAELRALDLALQAAYDRGASDAEIAPMWVTRDALLASARSGGDGLRLNQI
ncbi:MAG: hypothetical protein ABWX88_05295 [Pseudoxanthomonas sp.]